MSTIPVETRLGLPEEMRQDAARLYYEAFSRKLHPILGKREACLDILSQSLDMTRAIIAVCDHTLIGLVGIQHGQQPFLKFQKQTFTRRYGKIFGLVWYRVMLEWYREYTEGELLLDGFAVDAEQRSLGIGTLLLEAVIQFAREHGYQTVRLDVVDTNPHARRLYEWMGFKATQEHHYPYLRGILGIGGETTMIRTVCKKPQSAGKEGV